jgi:hypothetical protein
MQSAGLTLDRQNSALSKRNKLYKEDSTNCKEIKTIEMVCCMLKTGVTWDSAWNFFTANTSSWISKVMRYYIPNFCRLTMPKKQFQSSVDQYTDSIYISEHSVKIRKQNSSFSKFITLQVKCCICIFKCPVSQGVSRN